MVHMMPGSPAIIFLMNKTWFFWWMLAVVAIVRWFYFAKREPPASQHGAEENLLLTIRGGEKMAIHPQLVAGEHSPVPLRTVVNREDTWRTGGIGRIVRLRNGVKTVGGMISREASCNFLLSGFVSTEKMDSLTHLIVVGALTIE